MSKPTLYRINPEPHDDHDGSYTGGLPDPISFLVDDGVLVPVEPTDRKNLDDLAACIGYGIDLQEASDIIDFAVKGRAGLTPFQQGLYDKARRMLEDYDDA